MKVYYSNYVKRLSDGKRSALYHDLNGNFAVFSNHNALREIDSIVNRQGKLTAKSESILAKLIEKGLLLTKNMTKAEEYVLYKGYYVVPNHSIFCRWIQDKLELSIPTPKRIRKMRISKQDGEMWLDLFTKEVTLEKLEKDYSNLLNLSDYKNSLFQLSAKGQSSGIGTHVFSNLYLQDFYLVDFAEEQQVIIEKSHFEQMENEQESLYLKLTDACNLSCKMCGQANNRKLELVKGNTYLDFLKLKKFIEPIIEKFEYINLWGGEPLLNPMFHDYIDFFSNKGKFISIATNGTLLKKYAWDIVEFGVDEIVVSIDGPPDIHNSIRGVNNAFENAINGIQKVNELKKHKQIKPKIVVNCTIIEENIDYLVELLHQSKEWNVNKLIYQFPMFITKDQGEAYEAICNSMWGIKPSSWRGFLKTYEFDFQKLYDFYLLIKNSYRNYAGFYNVNFNNKEELADYFNKPNAYLRKAKCAVLDKAILIEANGDLVTCPDFPDIKYNNIERINCYEYWKSEIRQEFIKYFNENQGYPICKRCCQFV